MVGGSVGGEGKEQSLFEVITNDPMAISASNRSSTGYLRLFKGSNRPLESKTRGRMALSDGFAQPRLIEFNKLFTPSPINQGLMMMPWTSKPPRSSVSIQRQRHDVGHTHFRSRDDHGSGSLTHQRRNFQRIAFQPLPPQAA